MTTNGLPAEVQSQGPPEVPLRGTLDPCMGQGAVHAAGVGGAMPYFIAFAQDGRAPRLGPFIQFETPSTEGRPY